MSTFVENELFASQAGTTATTVYSPGASIQRGVVVQLIICNTDSVKRTWSLWFDSDGSTYNNDSIKFIDQPIEAKETLIISVYLGVVGGSGKIAISADVANKVTISGHGAEVSV